MNLLYDNAHVREIFASRSDLMDEMDGSPEETCSRTTSSRPSGSTTLAGKCTCTALTDRRLRHGIAFA
jgi:hypothetical protein